MYKNAITPCANSELCSYQGFWFRVLATPAGVDDTSKNQEAAPVFARRSIGSFFQNLWDLDCCAKVRAHP